MNNIKNSLSGLCIAIASVALLAAATFSTGASASLAPVIIDDFEDGDTSDWGFFGVNNAGGGGGPLGDRPQAGDYYLSTGWGGEGTASTLFSRADEVETSWKIVGPILDAWKNRVSIERYRAGTWDIPAMDELTKDCVGGWHKPSAPK